MLLRKRKLVLTIAVIIILITSCAWYYSTHRAYAIMGYYHKNAKTIKSEGNHFNASGVLEVLFHYKWQDNQETLTLSLWKDGQQKPLENSVLIGDTPIVHNGWANLRTPIAQTGDLRLIPGKYRIYLYNKGEQIGATTFIVDNTFTALHTTPPNILETKATRIPGSPRLFFHVLYGIVAIIGLFSASALTFQAISLFRNRKIRKETEDK
jgi:hypothetical protein